MATSMVVYEGMNYMLNSSLKGVAATSTWYAGVITNSGYTPALSHTLAGNLASMGEVANFGGTRALLSATVATGVYDATASPVQFTNSSTTVTAYGVFVCSQSAVGNSTGTLLGVYLFTSARTLANGEILQVPVTLTDSN